MDADSSRETTTMAPPRKAAGPIPLIERLIDLFVPPAAFRDPDPRTVTRYRSLIRLSLVVLTAAFLLPPYLWIRSSLGIWEYAGFASLFGGPLLGALLIRFTGNMELAVGAMALNGAAGNIAMCIGTGGLQSPFAPFALLGLALCILNSRTGLIVWVASMAMLNYAALFALHLADRIDPPDMTMAERVSLQFICYGFGVLLLLWSALAALKARNRAKALQQAARDAAEQALDRLKSVQTQLVQSEKMAALGQLVAGVAHEINTPVGLVVAGVSQLSDETAALRRRVESGQLGREALADYLALVTELAEVLRSNGDRAANLVRSFKRLAVDQTTDERHRFPLRNYLNDTVMSLGPALRKAGHQVALDCPEDLELDSYPGALSQIVTNLLSNSIVHGYPDGRAGQIAIRAGLIAGDRVEMTYADDGIGIAETVRGRVFDPFFTTNRRGGSTGLGLHIVFNLVSGRLGGRIALTENPQGGAQFVVTFPRVSPVIAEPPASAPHPGNT